MQNTGEDWDNVALTLSTASPLLASELPKVQPWRITTRKVWRGQDRRQRATLSQQNYASTMRPSLGSVPDRGEGLDDLLNRSETLAISAESFRRADVGPAIQVSEGAISSTFAIDGLSTVPSDNSSHKVSIAVSDRTS